MSSTNYLGKNSNVLGKNFKILESCNKSKSEPNHQSKIPGYYGFCVLYISRL